MKLAFSIPTNTAAEQAELFANFRAAGFAGLQLKGGQYQRYLSEPQQFLDDWGHEPGATSAIIFGGALDENGLANLRRAIAFAAAVGADMLVFCHSHDRAGLTPEALRDFAHILSDEGAAARQQGVRLSLHHHAGQPVMHRDEIRRFFDAARPGTVGLTIDTAHLALAGHWDAAPLIREFAAVLDNVHLKDCAAASGPFKPLGQGDIDFAPVFAALREIAYGGWLCADEESGLSVRDSLALSHRFLTQGWQLEQQ